MNLKHISFWLILFLFFSIAASAQQATKADIQNLEVRVSNLEITVKEMDKRLTNKIEELDKRLTVQIQAVNARIDELDKHISTIINILIGVVLAAIALPQVLGYLQGRRERKELQNQIQQLGERIEHQQQKIFEKLIQ
jgi:predicted PurR-regulated permease PerM